MLYADRKIQHASRGQHALERQKRSARYEVGHAAGACRRLNERMCERDAGVEKG